MKLIFIFVTSYLLLSQIINCKKFRAIANDEILNYDLDKSVTSWKEYISLDNMVLEQIDDDNIEIGGYIEPLKSFDPDIPMQLTINTQSLEQSVWKDQPMKLNLPDSCKEFLNPDRFWYKFTKLWTANLCPLQKGMKMPIETQNCSALIDLPNNSDAPWRGYVLATQITKLGKKIEFGFGLGADFVPV